ncbi:MAG: hypothetical protein WC471_05695 [Candidatus Woesearchaeota archaeon]
MKLGEAETLIDEIRKETLKFLKSKEKEAEFSWNGQDTIINDKSYLKRYWLRKTSSWFIKPTYLELQLTAEEVNGKWYVKNIANPKLNKKNILIYVYLHKKYPAIEKIILSKFGSSADIQ